MFVIADFVFSFPSGWLNINFRASESSMKLASIMLSAAENHANKLQISNLNFQNLKPQISIFKVCGLAPFVQQGAHVGWQL